MSAAAGRKLPVKSKEKLQHDQCRMSIDPPQADRIKEFFLFYLFKIAERSEIHNSSIDLHHSSFDKVSYEGSGFKGSSLPWPPARRSCPPACKPYGLEVAWESATCCGYEIAFTLWT
jgi:hypothetical protein